MPSQSLCVAARMPRGDRGSGGSGGSRCRGGTFLALVNVTVRLWLGGGLGRVGGGGGVGEGPFSRISMYGVSPPPFTY